jgi:UDP:flavonoid glycosyltransferase YjiC (YdhE family)
LTLASGLLARGHEVVFFTCGDALELLRESFGDDTVYHLETPRFVIVRKRVSYVRTGLKGLGFLFGHRRRRNAAIEQLFLRATPHHPERM